MLRTLGLLKNSTLFFAGLFAVVLVSNSAQAQWLSGKRPPNTASAKPPSIGPLKVLPKRAPQRHIPLIYKRPAADPRSQLEAYALCQSCAFEPSNSAFNQKWPRKIPPTVIPYAPNQTAPRWFHPFNKTNWREIWGIRHARAAGPKFMRWGHHIIDYTSATLSALRKTAKAAVAQTRHGISGTESKGWCKEAVNDILTRSGILKERIPGKHARMAAPYLRNLKDAAGKPEFVDISADLKGDAAKAPEGAIIVYTGGKSGHIEMKIGNEFCSDFCAGEPIDRSLSRRVIGIFLPVKSGAQ